MRLRLNWCIWSYLYITIVSVSGSPPCEQTGACSCERSDGSLLDLMPLVQNAPDHFFETTYRRATANSTGFEIDIYLFHPCKDAKYVTKESDVKNDCNTTGICHRNILVSQNKTTTNDSTPSATVKDTGYEALSPTSSIKFITSDKGSVRLHYSLNAIDVYIDLICVESSKVNNLVLSNYDSKSPTLAFYSANACFTPPSNQHSFGTTLLIIFFVMALTYLIAGCCVKHFLMGARGVEVIPNYNFWRELPDLVRDGITFIQNGFKPPARTATPTGQNPNPNSYDSI